MIRIYESYHNDKSMINLMNTKHLTSMADKRTMQSHFAMCFVKVLIFLFNFIKNVQPEEALEPRLFPLY